MFKRILPIATVAALMMSLHGDVASAHLAGTFKTSSGDVIHFASALCVGSVKAQTSTKTPVLSKCAIETDQILLTCSNLAGKTKSGKSFFKFVDTGESTGETDDDAQRNKGQYFYSVHVLQDLSDFDKLCQTSTIIPGGGKNWFAVSVVPTKSTVTITQYECMGSGDDPCFDDMGNLTAQAAYYEKFGCSNDYSGSNPPNVGDSYCTTKTPIMSEHLF